MVDDPLHYLIQHLEFLHHGTHDCLDIHGFGLENIGVCLHSAIGVDVDIGHYGGKPTFELSFPFVHCSVKLLCGDRRMCGYNIVHDLNF